MTPFDRMLDSIEWTLICPVEILNGDQPYATHRGVLTIGEKSLLVYQLSDGRRVIEAQSMAEFFGFETDEEFRDFLAWKPPEWETADERTVKWDEEQTKHLRARMAAMAEKRSANQ